MAEDSPRDAITEVTRRAILDIISSSWSGRFDDVDFLRRLYDLDNIPSNDSRYTSATGDIYQHRVNNYDWEDDWVFSDPRFEILRGDDASFLRFIAETVHPVVRIKPDQAVALVSEFNRLLEIDGWRLVPVREISGRPVYGAQQTNGRVAVFPEPTGWTKVDRQLQQARSTLQTADSEEKYQTVGLVCREVLISTAQATYQRAKYPPLDGVEPSETDAARMLEAIIAVELAGGPNEEARAHAKAALKLALALQHKRTADLRTAALCAEATVSVVNVLAILSGRRDR